MNRSPLSVLLLVAVVAGALAGCDAGSYAGPALNPPAADGRARKAGGNADAGHREDLINLAPQERARAGVQVETLRLQRVREELEVTATIGPNRERIANVLPRLPGRIASVSARLGDRVQRGQTLAVLESIEAAEAYAAHAQALAELAVAKAALERAERLRAGQIVPEKEHQRAQAEYQRRLAELRSTADRLAQLGLRPDQGGAQGQVATLPVAAPFAGTIIERKAVAGELAKTDESLFVIADLSTVWVEASIREADLARVREGVRARARVAAFPKRVFEGKVGYLGAVLDPETRTAPAIVVLDNRERLLRFRMFATVAIDTGEAREVLALPESAVTLVQGLPTVFVEEPGGFEARPVELAARAGGKAVIGSGVEAGERVATAGTYALKARLLKSQIGDAH